MRQRVDWCLAQPAVTVYLIQPVPVPQSRGSPPELLPVMVIVHCAFGIWMHTYFKAELAALDVVAAATGAINDQVG